MKHFRIERLEGLLTEKIALILSGKCSDSRFAKVTITGSKVSRDLHSAIVYFSLIASNEDIDSIGNSLNKAKSFFRRELSLVLDMKYIPEIKFIYDDSLERGHRILKEIESLNLSSDSESH